MLGVLGGSKQGAEHTSQGSPLPDIAARPRHSFSGLLDLHDDLMWQQRDGDNVRRHAGAAGLLSESCCDGFH